MEATMKSRKQWEIRAKIYIDDTFYATIRQCDDLFCYNASKAININELTLKRARENDFVSFDSAHNELLNHLQKEYEIPNNRVFIEKI
jgi:hypothetical protein